MKWVQSLGSSAGLAWLAYTGTTFAAVTNSTETTSTSLISSTNQSPAETKTSTTDEAPEQLWNWHFQNTDIVQGYPGFPAQYLGPNSLRNGGQVRETISVDLYGGVKLWHGAEAHVDGLMWQGFGLSKTLGVDGFPNGEAFRLGTDIPNVNFSRVFIRQTIGLGGQQETVEDDALHLAGKRDVSRV